MTETTRFREAGASARIGVFRVLMDKWQNLATVIARGKRTMDIPDRIVVSFSRLKVLKSLLILGLVVAAGASFAGQPNRYMAGAGACVVVLAGLVDAILLYRLARPDGADLGP